MYFNWLLDVLGYEFLTTHQVKEITIRFDREVEYGNLVESHFETIRDENHLETLHEIRIGETTYCEAAMKWHERTKIMKTTNRTDNRLFLAIDLS